MDLRKFVAVSGGAITTFLVVAAILIEAVTAATGADVGPGIIGVTAGALAALGAVLAVSYGWSRLTDRVRWAVAGYGSFGLAMLVLAGLSYVNVPGADEYLSLSRNLVVSAVVALAVTIGGWRRGQPTAAA